MTRTRTPALLAALVVLTGCSSGASSRSTTTTPEPTPSRSPIAVTESPIPSAPTSSAPAAASRGPRVSDFKLGYKIRSKQCFGDAGCSLEVEPTILWVGPASAEPGDDDSFELTYEILGDESGPVIGTIVLHGSSYDTPIGTGLTTPSSRTKLSIRATALEKL